MTAILVVPSFYCTHGEHEHCDRCTAEFILPGTLQVCLTSYGVVRAVFAGSLR